MESTENLLTSISISFEDDNASSSCVEMNLVENSPGRARRKQAKAANVSASDSNGLVFHDPGTGNTSTSAESRNDGEEFTVNMPFSPPAMDMVSSIFRHNEQDSINSASDATATALSLPDSPEKRAFTNSVSYDGLFEVRTSKHRTSHVGPAINPLYEELRQIATTSVTLADEALDQETSDNDIHSAPSAIQDKKHSLMARADEILQEARKACSRSNSTVSEPNYFNDTSETDICNRGFLNNEIRRTQSLDRVLSSKEVLEMATRALREKEMSERRMTKSQDSKISHKKKIRSDEDQKATKNNDKDKAGKDSNNISASIRGEVASNDATECSRSNSIPLNTPKSPKSTRDAKVLKRLSGITDEESLVGPKQTANNSQPIQLKDSVCSTTSRDPNRKIDDVNNGQKSVHKDPFSIMKFLWGGEDEHGEYENRNIARINPDLLSCSPAIGKQLLQELREGRVNPNRNESLGASLMRRRPSKHGQPPSYAEVAEKSDPKLQDWVDNLFSRREEGPADGTYVLGKSKTVVVHEIVRGNWTHAAAWSPDGNRLAVGTENHHLAIIDTRYPVFRVLHDKRVTGPTQNDTTHSIRAIAWGAKYIAIGGSGNAVSILATTEPYAILHTIKGVGFVGSLAWRVNSDVLAIGSRIDRAMLVRIRPSEEGGKGDGRQLRSDIIETIHRRNWVNAVAFSPGGIFLAVGDGSGILSIFRYVERNDTLSLISTFTMEDAVLVVSFSPDGKFLYSAGEDFRVTCIETNHWEIIHRIRRDRWVQCIESSRGGSHVAVGGVTTEISILEVNLGWDAVLSVELKGLIPLACAWHPKDHYLALCGQSKSILVAETTNARHVAGSCLWSCSGILAVEFSPDGRMAAVGNVDGVITFFKLEGNSFVTIYEMIVMTGESLCISWSPNGKSIAIGSDDTLIIVGRGQASTARPNRPANASGFSVRKVKRGLGSINSVSFDFRSRYIVVSGAQTRVFDVKSDYSCSRILEAQDVEANAWSPDGRWLATIGQSKTLTIYDTDFESCGEWREAFSIEASQKGLAIAWGPTLVGGLAYLAFGGVDKSVTVVEIRTNEGTWERVLTDKRGDDIHDLDWSTDGLLAVAVANGTVNILDLSYLQSGLAVNELSYDAQRQGLTCFTEIRRNRGRNCMQAVRWVPAPAGSDNLLAVGGSDGELEIVSFHGN